MYICSSHYELIKAALKKSKVKKFGVYVRSLLAGSLIVLIKYSIKQIIPWLKYILSKSQPQSKTQVEPNLSWRPQTLRLSKYWPFIWCSWTNSLRAPADHRQRPNQTHGWELPLLRGNKLGLTLKIRISLLSISSVHTLKNSLWRVLETYGIYFSSEAYHLVWTIVRGFFFFFVLKPIINEKHPVIKNGKVTNYGLPLLHFNAFFS